MFGFLHWNPARELFVLPVVHLPILWYGFFFGFGFFIAYLIFLTRLKVFFRKSPYFLKEDILEEENLLAFLKKNFTKSDLGRKKSLIETLNHLVKQENLTKKIPSGFLKKKSFSILGKNREALDRFLSPYVRTLHKKSVAVADKLLFYVILGTVLGAKLGHFFFYEDFFTYYRNPLELLQGRGFASHGAVIGVFIAGYIFIKKRAEFSWKSLLDLMVLPSLFIAGCIRLGNFFNQEVLGKISSLPWAIVFESPLDGSGVYPRHPAQLYEALFYFFLFGVFFFQTKKSFPQGKIAGALLSTLFSFRFFIEFFKEEQSVLGIPFFNMGQLLSIPLVLLGFWLFFTKEKSLVGQAKKWLFS